MSKPLNVSFLGMTAVIHSLTLSLYQNNNAPAVIANVEYSDGDTERLPISVNIDGYSDRFVGIETLKFVAKNYSERAELFEQLVAADWIRTTGETIQSGYVHMPICILGEEAIIKQMPASIA